MLGWLYLVGVLMAVAVIVYLDRGSIGRGHIDIEESLSPEGRQASPEGRHASADLAQRESVGRSEAVPSRG